MRSAGIDTRLSLAVRNHRGADRLHVAISPHRELGGRRGDARRRPDDRRLDQRRAELALGIVRRRGDLPLRRVRSRHRHADDGVPQRQFDLGPVRRTVPRAAARRGDGQRRNPRRLGRGSRQGGRLLLGRRDGRPGARIGCCWRAFDAPKLLATFTAIACAMCLYVAAVGGVAAGFVALAIGLFNSIMFPVIFTITLERSISERGSDVRAAVHRDRRRRPDPAAGRQGLGVHQLPCGADRAGGLLRGAVPVRDLCAAGAGAPARRAGRGDNSLGGGERPLADEVARERQAVGGRLRKRARSSAMARSTSASGMRCRPADRTPPG